MRRHHPLLLCKTTVKNVKMSLSSPSCNASTSSSTSETPILTVSSAARSQLNISTMFGNMKKYISTSNRAIEITSKIARFLIKDLRPYSLVDSVQFKDMVYTLDMKYQVPSRKQFSDVIVPRMYDEVKDDVLQALSKAEQVALTTDSWTSRATESFVTVTSTHISEDWQLVNYVLQTRTLEESHTAENIADELNATITEWNIPTGMGIPPIVTDNAANITKAVKLLGSVLHVGCLAHSINLAVQKSLKVKKASHVLARIRKMVAFFHRSTTAAALLKSKAELLGLPSHKLKIDVATRWNSAYDMLERYIEMQCAVVAALRSKELGKIKDRDLTTLSDEDTSLAEEMVICLKPLKDITTMLSSENSPTVSIIMPLKYRLLSSLLSPNDDENTTIAEMKHIMATDLQGRYIQNENRLNVATLVDARFKKLPYLSDSDKSIVFNSMVEQVIQVNEVGRASTVPSSSKPSLKSNVSEPHVTVTQIIGNDCLNEALPALPDLPVVSDVGNANDNRTKDAVQQSESTMSFQQPTSVLQTVLGELYVTAVEPVKSLAIMVEIEGQQYKDVPPISLTDDPLIWWKEKQAKFPLIAKLAKALLCIPATSVPSERIFSTAGDIVTDQRARLKPKHVDKLIFLKKNMK